VLRGANLDGVEAKLVNKKKRSNIMKKLIPNTDYGIELAKMVIEKKITTEKAFLLRCKYDQLLKQPLALGMFVACDSNGNILEEPDLKKCAECLDHYNMTCAYCEQNIKQYQEAHDSLLFEGFAFHRDSEDYYFLLRDECYMTLIRKNQNDTIESLIGQDYNLTATAQKQIGL
jgi:hypothetical protein